MWQGKAYGPIARYTNPNVEFKMDQWIEDIRNSVPRQVPNAGPVTEDCLFLDVHVPKAVLERASDPTFDGVPILFWVSLLKHIL